MARPHGLRRRGTNCSGGSMVVSISGIRLVSRTRGKRCSVSRRDRRIWLAQEPFDEDDLAHIVALVVMPEPLQRVADDEQGGRTPPQRPQVIPKLHEGQRDRGDSHRDADHVQPE